MIDATAIPAELKDRAQWVVWRAENGTKIPYDAKTGRHAKSNDPATWADFRTALDASAAYSGVGYVFAADDPYTGIDLDDCIEGEAVASWAEQIVLDLASYSEVSPSRKGIKIWVKGSIPSAVKTKRIEIYDRGRYFTMTGWHVEGTPETITVANGALDRLWTSLQPKDEPPPEPTHTTRAAGRKYLERWAQRKIDYAVERVQAATDGEKHNERYAMARLLGGLVPHGLATEDQIARALFDANTPKTEAQRREWKTIVDGIRDGGRAPLPLPDEPEQPIYDAGGYACCPKHRRILDAAHSGNGWVCRARDSSTENSWCSFWWDGDGYLLPTPVDPETGEPLHSDSTDFLLNAHRSDTGNAECLVQLSGDDLRYCHTREKWLTWDGSRWAVDDDGTAQRAMIAVVRARFRACEAIDDHDQRKKAAAWCIGCESSSKIESGLKVAGNLSALTTKIDHYDRDPFTAAAIGATLDLRTVVHRAVRREDFLTMRLGAAYDPEATCPRFVQFMDEVFAGDKELIAFLQRAIGYSLTGDTREQVMFLCHGLGMNGKSVLLNILSKLLGDYAANASFETFDANRRNESSNDLAMLRGKRLVTVIETEENRRLAEARVKSVTGQDLITCRFLYGEYFSYRPTYKIWLAMNHLPVIRGTDKGIWRRIRLIPFTQDFEQRQDKTLEAALEAALDGILQWALKGLRQWWQRGLDTPAIVTKATDKYRAESDQIGRWLNDNCVTVSNVSVAVAKAYQNYKAWCEASGEQPMTQNKLGRTLIEKGFDQSTLRNTRTWIGIGLKASDDESPE